ncbi:MAG TPA: response regulator [Steroidobacteraceae bacterium]|jgi:two-component system sensor histidine kinase/response regulator|nr:response regulator [Steroidobacteraceae bacterium]
MTSGIARLLIVDDEAMQLRALCDTLQLEGYRTQGFSSGQQALAALRPGEFDLLLTDLMMPEMDGITLINAAKRVDAALGAIVMTGHGTIDTAVRAMQGGALDYILKPFKLNVILPIISRALDVQRLRRENAELHAREKIKSAELAAAYHDLESFSYSISHDLRAPLRSMDGFAGILESEFADQLGEEGRRIIGVIRSGSRRMDELIVSLLEFSRAGRGALELDRVDMTMLAESAAAETKALHTRPQALIEISDLPAIDADAILIRQVWCNLIGNAMKYSAKRELPKISVSGHVADREVIYEVEDNGAGFDMRYADKLFGVFQRLHSSDDFAGTGVGLAIVHRIIARHGGRIWAQGSPDAGACFRFALPMRTAL